MFSKKWLKFVLIFAAAGLLFLADLPPEKKEFFNKIPIVGEKIAKLKINLGLDLQGGTHLDYRVITDDVPESDIPKIVAGVKEVIERRVNGLGVAEPNIFDSRVGDEYHIVVELAGIKDIEEAKAIVGKTIQLEFKEQKTEIDTSEADEIHEKANDFLARAVAEPERFEEIFADFEDKPKITFKKDEDVEIEGEVVQEGWMWVGDLNEGLQAVAGLEVGGVYSSLIPSAGEYFVDSSGGAKEKTGFYVAQLIEKEDAERVIEIPEERKASHILIDFAGTEMAADTQTRTKKEAEEFAEEILEKALALQNGETLTANEADEEDSKILADVDEESSEVEDEVAESEDLSAEDSEDEESEELSEEDSKGEESEESEEIEESSEEENLENEEEIQNEVQPQNFAELAEKYSDGPTASEGGDLGFFAIDKMVPEFAGAVFNSAEFGVFPEVVETQFGFHIISYQDLKESTSESKNETRVKLAQAFFSTSPDGWRETGLTGQHFRRADVGSDPTTMRPIVSIYFTQVAISDNGMNWWIFIWYLLATAAGISLFSFLIGIFMSEGRSKNLKRDKILALVSAVIFVGSVYGAIQADEASEEIIGEDLTEVEKVKTEAVTESEATVGTEAEKTSEVIGTGIPEGEVSETDKTGVDLFAEITKRNLQKPIAIFLDGLPVIDTNGDGVIDEFDPAYAPVVQSEIINGQAVISGLKSYEEANKLAQNLNTGAIPAPVKLSGQFTVGATLGEEALVTSLEAGIYGLIAVMVFMIFLYRLSGVIASLALVIYGVSLVFALQVFGVVFTLAGVAGVILSVGMAVDANILIFERMKEELKLGKSLSRSVEDGFARAWTSIRDSNVSSIITCVILFWFGSSIIQGFALTLCVGILLSMFSAITVSRTFLRISTSLFKNEKLYGGKNK